MATLSKAQTRLAIARLENREGRSADHNTILNQIGRATVFGVSGGQVIVIRDHNDKEPIGVLLPCGPGRAVEVVLNFLDLYDVRRVRLISSGKNAGEVVVEHEVTDLYFDQLPEAVWQASVWR